MPNSYRSGFYFGIGVIKLISRLDGVKKSKIRGIRTIVVSEVKLEVEFENFRMLGVDLTYILDETNWWKNWNQISKFFYFYANDLNLFKIFSLRLTNTVLSFMLELCN